MARRLYDPVYRRWFRVEWEGIDKIPRRGGALIVANHAGAIPPDAPVIMHGIETELGRPVYGLADALFRQVPVVGTLWSRFGGVVANPDNAYRLLRECQQLVLVFPEGTKGTGKLYSQRYRLRRFGRGGFVEVAMRAGVPVVPVAVIGAEEAMPIVWQSDRLAQALGLPYAPVTLNALLFGPLGLALYLPAKIRLRVLDPVTFDVAPDQTRYPKSRIYDEAEAIRAPGCRRPSSRCWRIAAASGSAETPVGRRVLVTGLSTFWGGRVARALERDPGVEIIVGLDRLDPTVPLERTEFVRADQAYSILSRIVRATQVDTIVHTFLVVDSTQVPARSLHEINVIGTMNLLAAAAAPDSSVDQLVVKSSALVYGSSPRDPTWWSEEMERLTPPRTNLERSLLEVEGYVRDFAEDNPQRRVAVLRFSNVLGAEIVTPVSRALSLPAAPSIFGFDPLLQFVEEGDVVRALEFAMGAGLTGVFNVAGDGRLPWSEVAAIWPAGGDSPLPPLLTSQAGPPWPRIHVVDLPPELLALLRFGRGVDNRRLKAAGFRYRFTTVLARWTTFRPQPTPACRRRRYRRSLSLRAGCGELLPPLPRRGPRPLEDP